MRGSKCRIDCWLSGRCQVPVTQKQSGEKVEREEEAATREEGDDKNVMNLIPRGVSSRHTKTVPKVAYFTV